MPPSYDITRVTPESTRACRGGLRDTIDFLGQYLQNPMQVGSLTPSSRVLARAMVRDLTLEGARIVVEYGPGTGVFTRHILDRLTSDARYYALEPNPVFHRRLKRRFPQVDLIADGAERAADHLARHAGEVDAVFCGLPFSFMSRGALRATVEATSRLLRPGGHFRAFLYHHTYCLPKLTAFRRLIARHVGEVRTVAVWTNLPPAMVVSCQK